MGESFFYLRFTIYVFIKIYQLDSRHCGLEPLVACFHTCAINRLLKRICRDDAVNYWNIRLHRGLRDSLRYFRSDVLEVRSLAANDCADADKSVPFAACCEPLCQKRNLERTWAAKNLHRLFICAQTLKSIERALYEPRCQKIIPTTRNHSEAKPFGIETTLMN